MSAISIRCWTAPSRLPMLSGFPHRARHRRRRNPVSGWPTTWRPGRWAPPAETPDFRLCPGWPRRTVGWDVVTNGQGHETTFAQIAAAQFGSRRIKLPSVRPTPMRRPRWRPWRLAFTSTSAASAARMIIEKVRISLRICSKQTRRTSTATGPRRIPVAVADRTCCSSRRTSPRCRRRRPTAGGREPGPRPDRALRVGGFQLSERLPYLRTRSTWCRARSETTPSSIFASAAFIS